MNYSKEKTFNNKVGSHLDASINNSLSSEVIEKNIKEIKREFEHNPRNEYTIIKCADKLNKLNQPELALNILKRTYNLKDHSNDFYRLCGDTMFNLKDLDSAIEQYEIFLKKDDKNPLLLNRMGNIYEMKYDDTFDKKYLQTAIRYFTNAFNLDNNRMYLKNLVICFGKIGDIKTHRELFRRLLDCNPTAGDLWDYSCSNFRYGDIEESLKYIDYRFCKEEPIYYPQINRPLWDLKDAIFDKTLLVHCEQGFGDTFMFSRFLKTVKDKAKKVIFITQKNTFKLIKNSFPEIEIYPDDIDLNTLDFDFHIPLMTLMKLWDFEKNTLDGYLKVQESDVEEFKNKFFDNKKLNIGISYYGTENNAFKYRNIDLKEFEPLKNHKNVQLYSFQYGDKLKEEFKIQEKEMGIINLSEHFNDFYDTAVAVSALDLIVTADNVLLNLAGALGKKTYALMNAYSEYRWYKLQGDDIGWYKSVKPFVAQEMNGWEDVINEIIGNNLLDCHENQRFSRNDEKPDCHANKSAHNEGIEIKIRQFTNIGE